MTIDFIETKLIDGEVTISTKSSNGCQFSFKFGIPRQLTKEQNSQILEFSEKVHSQDCRIDFENVSIMCGYAQSSVIFLVEDLRVLFKCARAPGCLREALSNMLLEDTPETEMRFESDVSVKGIYEGEDIGYYAERCELEGICVSAVDSTIKFEFAEPKIDNSKKYFELAPYRYSFDRACGTGKGTIIIPKHILLDCHNKYYEERCFIEGIRMIKGDGTITFKKAQTYSDDRRQYVSEYINELEKKGFENGESDRILSLIGS